MRSNKPLFLHDSQYPRRYFSEVLGYLFAPMTNNDDHVLRLDMGGRFNHMAE